MGAWGYDPVESDNGQEFYAVALRGIDKKIRKGLQSTFQQEPMAAAALLERVGFLGMYPGDLEADLELAVSTLRAKLASDEPDEWQDPERRRSGLRRLLIVLEARQKKPHVPGTQLLWEKLGITERGKFA